MSDTVTDDTLVDNGPAHSVGPWVVGIADELLKIARKANAVGTDRMGEITFGWDGELLIRIVRRPAGGIGVEFRQQGPSPWSKRDGDRIETDQG